MNLGLVCDPSRISTKDREIVSSKVAKYSPSRLLVCRIQDDKFLHYLSSLCEQKSIALQIMKPQNIDIHSPAVIRLQALHQAIRDMVRLCDVVLVLHPEDNRGLTLYATEVALNMEKHLVEA